MRKCTGFVPSKAFVQINPHLCMQVELNYSFYCHFPYAKSCMYEVCTIKSLISERNNYILLSHRRRSHMQRTTLLTKAEWGKKLHSFGRYALLDAVVHDSNLVVHK